MDTKQQMYNSVEGVIYPNSNNEIEGLGHQNLLKYIIDQFYPTLDESDSAVGGTTTYDPLFEYEGGEEYYVLYNDKIWEFVSATNQTGVEPGTNSSVWVEFNISKLAHIQNTDFKVGNHIDRIDISANTTISMNTAARKEKNVINLDNQGTSLSNFTINIDTGAGKPFVDHMFMVIVRGTVGSKMTFANTSDMYVGNTSLVLEAKAPGEYDWAVFKKIGTVTRLLYSSKGPSAVSMSDITDVDDGEKSNNYALMYDGSTGDHIYVPIISRKYSRSLSTGSGSTYDLDMTSTILKNKNTVLLTAENNCDVSVISVNGTDTYNFQLLLVMEDGQSTSITFTNDANQEIGDNDLVLTENDWALFQGNINGKTRVLTSNKLQGTGGGSGQTIPEELLASATGEKTTLTAADIFAILDSEDSNSLKRVLFSNLQSEIIGDTIDEVSTNVDPNILESGTGIAAPESNGTDVDLGGSATQYTVDEFVGKYLILDFTNNTGISPTPLIARKITANTADGVITVDTAITETGTDVDWQIVEPHAVTISGRNNVIACNATNNIVIEVPAIVTDDERNRLLIYREKQSVDTDDYKVFVFFEDTYRGSNTLELLRDYETYEFAAHTQGTNHWDEFRKNNVPVILNVDILTPDTTGLSNTTKETVKATAWNLRNPAHFVAEEESDGSIVITCTNRVPVALTINIACEVVRTANNPNVTIEIEKDTGSGFTKIDEQTIATNSQVTEDGRTFFVSAMWEFGFALRVMAYTDAGTYYINQLKFAVSETNI